MEERYRNDAEMFSSNLWEFQGDEFDFDSTAVYSSLSASDESSADVRVRRKKKPTKSADRNSTAGYKIRINGKRRHITDKSVMSALCRTGLKPNVSRRPPSNILYAFPNFDKCDSLLYFPSTMTKYLNTGDMTALTKLFNTHLDKNCEVSAASCYKAISNAQQLLKTYELMNELQPDRIMCVHTTKVVKNQILASVHLKFTDCKAIYDSVYNNTLRHQQGHFLSGDRALDMKRRLEEDTTLPVSMKEQYLVMAEAASDFVVYVHLSMAFTFDDTTKKVTEMSCEGRLSSMHAVDSATKDLCDT